MADTFQGRFPGARPLTPNEQKAMADALHDAAMDLRPKRKPHAFDTGPLMSSLREMVTADIHVQMFATGVLHASKATIAEWRARYSRHETVVREQLQALADVAASYKAPPRMGGSK